MEKKAQSPEKILLRISAIAIAVGVLISAAIVTANATDDHIGRVADERNRPLVSMVKFIMVQEGLWDKYAAEQDSANCADRLILGLSCNRGAK